MGTNSETSKVTGFAVDNAAGALTDISAAVNNVDWSGGNEKYDDTGLGDTRHTQVNGLGVASQITVNGWMNSTTRAIFPPIIDGTSVNKTVEVKLATGDYYSGECVPDATAVGLPAAALNTWSCTLSPVDGMTSTSVTGAS